MINFDIFRCITIKPSGLVVTLNKSQLVLRKQSVHQCWQEELPSLSAVDTPQALVVFLMGINSAQ